jgi:ribonuclease HI
MTTTRVVLLRKIRSSREDWAYIVDRTQYVSHTNGGPMPEQFIDVMEEIRAEHAANGEKLVVISPSLVASIEEEKDELYPDVKFMKLADSAQLAAFMKVFTNPTPNKRGQGKTLFIGSDASGGHHETISAWAWATSGNDANYSMGICEFRDINISEFEGILRAIIENQDADYEKLHVYSDSQRAIDYFERAIEKDESLTFTSDNYLAELVDEVREIVVQKSVRVEWVRGHRGHRLNTAADVISRHARKSAQSGKSIRTMQREADAMFELFR